LNVLVSYDVSTTSPEGRQRLRRIAQACLDYGQRVQFSVFECTLSDTNFVKLRSRLLDILDTAQDSLRIYRLGGNLSEVVESHGVDRKIDFDDSLIV
jgi:CRISPR-associated protein Cas2